MGKPITAWVTGPSLSQSQCEDVSGVAISTGGIDPLAENSFFHLVLAASSTGEELGKTSVE